MFNPPPWFELVILDFYMQVQANKLIDSSFSIWDRCGFFLINLDRSSDRLDLIHEDLAASNIPYQRVRGFDAGSEDLKICNVNLAAFQRTHGRRTIRSGEVGCYQSHLKAIQYFLDSGKEFGIILEDDVVPEPFLEQSVSQLIRWSGEWDIVALFHFHSGTPVKMQQQASVTLSLYLTHIASSAAYMLNRRSAATLLLHLAEQRACVDHALFEKWVHGLRLRGVSPMPIRLSPQAHVSTIGVGKSDKYPFFQRLPTFIKRSACALQIFSHSIKELWVDRLNR